MSVIFFYDNIRDHARQRGITRYFRYIADGAANHFGKALILLSSQRLNHRSSRQVRLPGFRGSVYPNDLLVSAGSLLMRPSVLFCPFYSNVQAAKAQVFTVHDMIPELYPEFFPTATHPFRDHVAVKRRCLERAAALIAVSHSTAKDIVRVYPTIDPRKIHVVYHGVKLNSADDLSLAPSYANERPYFLYVGLRTKYKNFVRFLEAFGHSGLAEAFDLRVVSPVGGTLEPNEEELLVKYHLADRLHIHTSVEDDHLIALYHCATAFVYPSVYEGFGMPILEAMAAGTLIATSNTSSMPEVGGDVAFYFDPLDTESIADCLRRVAHCQGDDRRLRINRGIARARQFTWEQAQQETNRILEMFT